MTQPVFIKLCDVEIPVDVSDFITPQWQQVLDYHATWVPKMRELGHDPWPFQPYMLEFAKQLAKLAKTGTVPNLRERTQDEWMQRCMEHYGLGFLAHYAALKTVP